MKEGSLDSKFTPFLFYVEIKAQRSEMRFLYFMLIFFFRGKKSLNLVMWKSDFAKKYKEVGFKTIEKPS